jgi:hypothetical protein
MRSPKNTEYYGESVNSQVNPIQQKSSLVYNDMNASPKIIYKESPPKIIYKEKKCDKNHYPTGYETGPQIVYKECDKNHYPPAPQEEPKIIYKDKIIYKERDVEKKNHNTNKHKTIIIEDDNEREDIPMVARDPVADVDVAKLSDPLLDPTRRVPRDMLTLPYLHQVSTRGFPDTYQQVGIAVRLRPPTEKTEEKILPLFGRQKYPRSTQYDYYVIMPKTNIKIQVYNRNNNELMDGDEIYIRDLNATYRVSLYKMETLEYNPYFV